MTSSKARFCIYKALTTRRTARSMCSDFQPLDRLVYEDLPYLILTVEAGKTIFWAGCRTADLTPSMQSLIIKTSSSGEISSCDAWSSPEWAPHYRTKCIVTLAACFISVALPSNPLATGRHAAVSCCCEREMQQRCGMCCGKTALHATQPCIAAGQAAAPLLY